jgi:hypothetical protein
MSTTATTSTGEKVRPAPWKGSLFILFEERPWVKPFLNWYLWVLIFGYPAIVALANSWQWSFLPKWLALWAPLTKFLSTILPIFQNFERAMALTSGLNYRTELIHHVLTYEWIISLPIFVAMMAATLTLPASAWFRFAARQPIYRLVFILLSSLIFFPACIFWITVGFDLVREGGLWDWHRSDLKVPLLGLFFGVAIMMAVMLCASFGALIAAGILWARQRSGAT